ncbi:MAG: PQQ-binding-like beta-propeller repeat protein [Bacteroidia bacterium]|nr:PQQ-binding-like beta-propeller repeat protein [Bacteroidia bacterium]
MKRFIFLVLAACAFASPSYAQVTTPIAWSAKFKSTVNWQRLHSLGYLVVNTNDGLYAVNPHDGNILWENKNFAALDPANYEEVAGTEFLTIAYKVDQENAIPLQAIVDVITGRVLFDSKKEGIGVLSRHVLPSSGRLLVVGVKPGELVATLFMFDITTGKQLWSNGELLRVAATGKGFLGKLQAGLATLGNLQSLTSEPVELADESMIITHPNYAMRINTVDGALMWKNDLQPSRVARILFSSHKKDVVYVATEIESETGSGFTTSSGNQSQPNKFYFNLYYAYNIDTGKPLWKKLRRRTTNSTR